MSSSRKLAIERHCVTDCGHSVPSDFFQAVATNSRVFSKPTLKSEDENAYLNRARGFVRFSLAAAPNQSRE